MPTPTIIDVACLRQLSPPVLQDAFEEIRLLTTEYRCASVLADCTVPPVKTAPSA